MEEKSLIRKRAIETYLKRFPIIILMMSICSIIILTVNLIINTITSSIPNNSVKLVLLLFSIYVVFQLLYGLNKTFMRIINDEKVTDIFSFLKDAISRFRSPLASMLLVILVATVYMIAVSIVGVFAMSIAASIQGKNSPIIESIRSLTIIIATFVIIIKVIPYEFAFFILAEDENKSISGLQALKKSKALLKDHVIDYIILLLPIVGIFLAAVIALALFHNFVYPIFSNPTVYYGVSILLEIAITPLVRLVEINYYNFLKDEK